MSLFLSAFFTIFYISVGPASALGTTDLLGKWKGGQDCGGVASRIDLFLYKLEKDPHVRLRYKIKPKGAKVLAGSGSIDDDLVRISMPKDNVLKLPEALGRLSLKEDSPRFTGKSELGVLENVAGLTGDFGLQEGGKELRYTLDLRLMGQTRRCQGLLRRAKALRAGRLGALSTP